MEEHPVGRRRVALLDRFDLVLLFVLVAIVTQSLIDVRSSYTGRFITHAVTGAALVVATRASGAARRVCRLMDWFVGLSVLGNLVIILFEALPGTGRPPPAIQPDAFWCVAAMVTPVLVAGRIMWHQRVTLQTVLGAVAAYLQLAVAYSLLFQTIDAWTPDVHFFGENVSSTVYMYFSLTTIATLGYGDFVPVTEVGRLAAMSEAVIGQVYLVTFVAMVVSRFAASPPGSNRRRRWRWVSAEPQAGEQPLELEAVEPEAPDAPEATGLRAAEGAEPWTGRQAEGKAPDAEP